MSIPANFTVISHFFLSAQPPAESLSTSCMLALSRRPDRAGDTTAGCRARPRATRSSKPPGPCLAQLCFSSSLCVWLSCSAQTVEDFFFFFFPIKKAMVCRKTEQMKALALSETLNLG